MGYPITNGRLSFPSMDVTKPLSTAEQALLHSNINLEATARGYVATTAAAGTVVLAGGPDETAVPGSTKVLTAGHFNAAGVTLTDGAGGQMFANEIYASFFVGQTPGLVIADAGGWRMQIGSSTPEDTVVDGSGVGSSNGDWRIGNVIAGERVYLGFENGSIRAVNHTTSVGSFGFAFTNTDNTPQGYLGSDPYGLGSLSLEGTADLALTADNGCIKISAPFGAVEIDGSTLGFFGATPVIKQTGTPANATDLATAITLINNLKAKLIAYGLIA